MECVNCKTQMRESEGCLICNACGYAADLRSDIIIQNPDYTVIKQNSKFKTYKNKILETYQKYYKSKKGVDRPIFLKECRHQANLRLEVYPNTAQEILDWVRDEFYKLSREQ